MDIGLSGDQAEHYMQRAIYLCFAALDTLKRLVFVASLYDSLKVRCMFWNLLCKHDLLVRSAVLLLWLNVDHVDHAYVVVFLYPL